MPVKIRKPFIETFVLEKTDKEFQNDGPPTVIKVRLATNGDEEQRNSLWALTERKVNQDATISVVTRLGMTDLHREEVWLTLSECNIENEDGSSLFDFKDGRLTDKMQFEKAWGRLDPIMAEEIIEKVHEHNKQWGPLGN